MITIKCEICGKKLYITPFRIKSSKHHFCSNKCRGKWQSKERKGEKSPQWSSIKRTCKICGKTLYVEPNEIKSGQGKFCSRKCQGEWRSKNMCGKNSPNWRGGNVKYICKTCGKSFYIRKSDIKKAKNHFCSRSCVSLYTKRHFPTASTSIEQKVAKWLNDLKIEYIQQALVEGICRPDFLLSNKIVIQCDGDYWHSFLNVENRDRRQDFLLSFKGYKILRLTETDINKHPRKCIKWITNLR